MNWDAIGAVGELIGAIAVLITLVYLAVQIKAMRDMNKKMAIDGTYSKFNEVRQSIFENPELASLFLNGLENPDDLNGRDLFRFMAICETLFMNGEQFWLMMDRRLDNERIRNTMKYYAVFRETPGGKAFWKHPQSMNLTQEFRMMIEEQDHEGIGRFDLSQEN